jgi:hypothetical protein
LFDSSQIKSAGNAGSFGGSKQDITKSMPLTLLLRKSKGYEYVNFNGTHVVVPSSPIHGEPTTIHRHEVDEFIHEDQVPYGEPDKDGTQWHHKGKFHLKGEEYRIATDAAMNFLNNHAQHTHDNPIVTPYGHRVVFHPV